MDAFAAATNSVRFSAAMCAVFFSLGAPAAPAAECYPHCDYNHYYGPYDFTYVRPGLYAYPRCGPRGECSPYLDEAGSGVRRGPQIYIRFPRRSATRPPQ
jgi:hypothetical protein